MHQRSRAIAGLAAGLLAACGGAGADDAEQPQGGDAVKARLISERVRLVPGQEAWLGVTFEIRPKWHLYWNGLNETGGPPEVALTLPAGFTAGKIVWPAPMRHVLGGDILDHIYEKRVTLLIPVRVPASAEPGSTARFQAALTWMVCEEVCVLGETSVSLGLPVGEPGAGDPPPSPDARLFEEARARVPKPVPEKGAPFQLEWNDGAAVITVPGAERLCFYPGREFAGFESILRDGEAKGERLAIKIHPFTDGPVRLDGVLEIVRPRPAPPSIFGIRAQPKPGAGAGNSGGG